MVCYPTDFIQQQFRGEIREAAAGSVLPNIILKIILNVSINPCEKNVWKMDVRSLSCSDIKGQKPENLQKVNSMFNCFLRKICQKFKKCS